MSEGFKRFSSESDPERPQSGAGPAAGAQFEYQTFGLRKDISREFKFDLEKARNFDDDNVERAKQGVKEIFADAIRNIKAKSEEIKTLAFQEGRDTGYKEGYKAGEAAAREEFAPFLQTLEQLVEEISLFRKNMYPKVEREMVEMVIGLTRKIIQTEFAHREDSVRNIIQLAVGSILDRETLVIKVNPRDKEHADHYSPTLEGLYPDIRNLRIEASASVKRGGCIVQSNFGSVEADLDSLDAEFRKLLNIAPHPPEEPFGEALDPETGEAPATGETDTAQAAPEEAPGETPPSANAGSSKESPGETGPDDADRPGNGDTPEPDSDAPRPEPES